MAQHADEDETDRSPAPSLREQQREVTRARILTALGELVETRHPLEVTMSAVAERAGVSEPTLYRHYPNKRSLFAELGSSLYRQTTADVVLSSLDELIEFLPGLYEQLAQTEATARWNLAAPQDQAVRPGADERMSILRDAAGPALADLDQSEADALLRVLLLLTSPIPLIYWQDYLGITVDEAAETAGWLIRRLASP